LGVELGGISSGGEIFVWVYDIEPDSEIAVGNRDGESRGDLIFGEIWDVSAVPEAEGGDVSAIDTERGLAALIVERSLFEPKVALVEAGDGGVLNDLEFYWGCIGGGDFELEAFEAGSEVEMVEPAAIDIEESGGDEGSGDIAFEVENPGDIIAEVGSSEKGEDIEEGNGVDREKACPDRRGFVFGLKEAIFDARRDSPGSGGLDGWFSGEAKSFGQAHLCSLSDCLEGLAQVGDLGPPEKEIGDEGDPGAGFGTVGGFGAGEFEDGDRSGEEGDFCKDERGDSMLEERSEERVAFHSAEL
jgi:hypothetical protein